MDRWRWVDGRLSSFSRHRTKRIRVIVRRRSELSTMCHISIESLSAISLHTRCCGRTRSSYCYCCCPLLLSLLCCCPTMPMPCCCPCCCGCPAMLMPCCWHHCRNSNSYNAAAAAMLLLLPLLMLPPSDAVAPATVAAVACSC